MPTAELHDPSTLSENLPLSGIRVVEFSHMVMGPTCGLILADLGADVIKVEPSKDGDNTRRLTGSGAGFFPMYNRNKRSLSVNIKDPRGLALVKSLIHDADILIENFRPGALDKMGIGYEALKAENEKLIYYSAKGFLSGPYDHRTALDEVVQMMGGLAYMTGPPGRPLRAGASVNDIMGGMFGVIGIMAALRGRDQSGKGSHVTSALFENCVFLSGQHIAQYNVTGQAARPMPERLSAWAIYDVFECSDGEQVFVGVVSDTQWRVFCESFALDDFANDPELATNAQRCHQRTKFLPKVRDMLGEMTSAEVLERCEQLGLPFAPIARPEDLPADRHLRESGGLLKVHGNNDKEIEVPALPFALDEWRPGVRLDIPKIGEHSLEIALAAGLSEEDVNAMLDDGVLTAQAQG